MQSSSPNMQGGFTMALDSALDKDGQVNKSKNNSQYQKLNPPITGGNNGSGTSSSQGMKEKKPGKMFAGGEG